MGEELNGKKRYIVTATIQREYLAVDEAHAKEKFEETIEELRQDGNLLEDVEVKKAGLKVKKGKIGHFTFKVVLGGMGKTVEEAWEDIKDSISMDGIDPMPEENEIELDEEQEEE